MSRGKYPSLEEARKKRGGIDRFAKEHPSQGNEQICSRRPRVRVTAAVIRLE